MVVLRLNDILNSESLFRSYDVKDLREIGFDEHLIKKLKEDLHQGILRGAKPYLCALVLNFLHRKSLLNGEPFYVPAVSFSEKVGFPLDRLLDIRQGDRELVVETEISGKLDLGIDVKDLHHFVRDYRNDSLTELATNYHETRNPLIRVRIVELAKNGIEGIARKVFNKIGGKVDFEDLVSDGNIGLLEALESYNPSLGVKFETHYSRRARGAMLDGIREVDPLERLDRKRLTKMQRLEERLRARENRLPSKEEYQTYWTEEGLPPDSFDSFYESVLRWEPTQSLNKVLFTTDAGSDREKGDCIEIGGDSTKRDIESRELLEVFGEELLVIPKEYRAGFRAFILEGVTMAEMGKVMGLSESRASQLVTLYLKSGSFFRRTQAYINGDDLE